MGCYSERILPRLIDAGMRNKAMTRYRPRIPAMAHGRVLEIGLGSGLNIPHYGPAVRQLFGLEPSAYLRERATSLAAAAPFPVELLDAGAERIPLDDGSMDCAVSTWTLCSIPELAPALLEVRRVLKPGGQLLFFEHGRSPDRSVARTQDWMAPVLRGLAGCNPNRAIDTAIENAGFRFAAIERSYLEGPRFIAWHFVGQAIPA